MKLLSLALAILVLLVPAVLLFKTSNSGLMIDRDSGSLANAGRGYAAR